MGASASKGAREMVSSSSRRQYPTKPSLTVGRKSRPLTAPHQSSVDAQDVREPWAEKSQTIERDGHDPHFAAVLRTIGPVVPTPTFSSSSTAGNPSHLKRGGQNVPENSTFLAMQSRARLAEIAEKEMVDIGIRGHLREFMDIQTIKRALVLRKHHGMSCADIENHLKLKAGVTEQLGRRGLVENVQV